MSSLAKHADVKNSLFNFIAKNLPSVKQIDIDDIVLQYAVTIIDEYSQDPGALPGFMELMSAYVPDFETINEDEVCSWLEAELTRKEAEEHQKTVAAPQVDLVLPNIETAARPPRNRNRSESEAPAPESPQVVEGCRYTEQLLLLKEMFPNSSMMEIRHCLTIAGGDPESAAGTLLVRREQGQAILPAVLQPAARLRLIDDSTLKYRIIERYSYVDEESEQKEHRPLAPKIEPKKLVRYRDGKIVSLKGERYTEVPKAGAEEESLKKPKKHCP